MTLVEPRDKVLGFLDDAIAQALLDAFQHNGIEVRIGATLGDVRVDDRGVDI